MSQVGCQKWQIADAPDPSDLSALRRSSPLHCIYPNYYRAFAYTFTEAYCIIHVCLDRVGVLSFNRHFLRFFSDVFDVRVMLPSLFLHHGGRVEFTELPCWDSSFEHVVQLF